jgi:glycosyltransferase involved in cell wall biosynthesis
MPGTEDNGLRFELKEELPDRIAVGEGTTRFLRGWCFHPQIAIRDLSVSVDGEPYPVEAHSQPREDVHWRSTPPVERGLCSFRSGFWGYVPLRAHQGPRRMQIELVAQLENGSRAAASVGEVEVVPENALEAPAAGLTAELGRAAAARAHRPLIAIAMATYNPRLELLAGQLDSIKEQTYADWICVISDDMSRPDRFRRLSDLIAGDERFVLDRSGERLGFYRNFERAMTMVPPEAELVCLADQDDRWDPDKLETLAEQLGEGVTLAYSDARIVDEDGELVSKTFWSKRPTNHSDLADLLISNTITGAASLFRRELLDLALPFPQRHGEPYHDHWLASVALATGEVRYLEQPLYDYVQHTDQALGHKAANLVDSSEDRWRLRLMLLRPRHARARMRGILAWWSAIYFADVCRISLASHVLLQRCGQRMSPRNRRAAERIVAAEHGLRGLAWMLWRRARRLGRRSPTLRQEGRLARAILWRRVLAAGLIGRAPHQKTAPRDRTEVLSAEQRLSVIEEKTAPLQLQISDGAPERVNLLIPDLDLDHFFGGYIAKFNLARRLAERGRRVRVLTLDGKVTPARDWRRRLTAFEGLERTPETIELRDASVRSEPVEVSGRDSFIATTWWTAQVAGKAAPELGRRSFVYVIQEYEPFTFPMGSLAALAHASYALPHAAVFSSDLLRSWFRQQRVGVYGEGRSGDAEALTFENALTTVHPAPAEELPQHRLLFYARPEPHAARNMYELGHLGLSAALSDGTFDREWEFYGTGAQRQDTIELTPDVDLELLARSAQADYASLLQSCSVGLALMYTPHPSLVPLEMAAAGMLVVTNTFANKTAEALAAISPNLIAVEPTVEGVHRGLSEAADRVGNAGERLSGADVRWARSWDQSFDDDFMERLEVLIEQS